MPNLVYAFDRYRLQYATTNPHGKDRVRIEFFADDEKVGQILSGAAITPGSFAALHHQEIHLYFDSAMVSNALAILQGASDLALFLEFEGAEGEDGEIVAGGITHA